MHLADRFDAVVSRADQAMVVVTTADAGRREGCLVGFHSQCSIEPRRYAVWLSKANATHDLALRAAHFAVHFLHAGQHDLADLFGGTTGDDVDKFASCEWEPGPDGVPVLSACPARIVGRKVSVTDDGSDHVCVVIAPVEVGVTHDADPLVPLRLSATTGVRPGHDSDEGER